MHSNVSFHEVAPRNTRALRFIKASFLCNEDRWQFNRNFNSQQGTHGFTVASLDPRQHSQWPSDYKKFSILPDLIPLMEEEHGHRHVERPHFQAQRALQSLQVPMDDFVENQQELIAQLAQAEFAKLTAARLEQEAEHKARGLLESIESLNLSFRMPFWIARQSRLCHSRMRR